MRTLQRSWEEEVKQSRIVIAGNDNVYLKDIGLNVWDVLHHLANGLGEQALRQRYPSLTEADLRACGLFGYLRAIKKL
ncbi:DUF433 domain-containing protein [Spirosoma rigui]|uniref:DUF433 domain-containing protein n=1 Tax=Spirosoma rigui TaxID=564064 RepID=UPI0009AF8655|nr:DUF433 domain-containing protein [Spirosoma rigui]